MSDETLGIAVIGAGSIGQDHIALIQSSRTSHLAGICDVTAEASDVAIKSNTPLYHDVETLIQREAPDGIIIATPNDIHAEHARICAAHQIPMLIEKPIAGTLHDARQIERLVTEQNATILVGHYRRFNPLVAKCRALLREGTIGKPIGASVMWSLRKPDDYFKVAWRTQRQNGGVALINLIHDIDDLRFMLGEIETVFAQSSNATRQLDVDDAYSISLQFANGALGTILVSDAAPSPWAYEATTRERDYFGHSDESCYYFVGTEGALAFPQLDLWRFSQNTHPDWRQSMERTRIDVERQNPLRRQFEHFLSIINGDAKPLVTATDAIRSLAVVFSVIQSAEQQRPIPVEETLMA